MADKVFHSRKRYWQAVVSISLFLMPATEATASGKGKVYFDVSHSVACYDVTVANPAWAEAGERVVEATIRVSMRITGGEESNLDYLIYTIQSPSRRLRVVDFSPRSEATSNIAGEIEVLTTREQGASTDAKVAAGLPVFFSGGVAQATPAIGVGQTNHETTTNKYSRVPKQQLLLASGTVDREHGVFFKLKPSPQHPLEGMREFTVRFSVPSSWQGDWITVQCKAVGSSGNPFFHKQESWGSLSVYIGLYLDGDIEARTLSDEVARRQEKHHVDPTFTKVTGRPNDSKYYWLPLACSTLHVVKKVRAFPQVFHHKKPPHGERSESKKQDEDASGSNQNTSTDGGEPTGDHESLASALKQLGRLSGYY